MTVQAWEQRYALEMILNGSTLLGGHMEVQQELTPDGFSAVRIVIHLPDKSSDIPQLPPAEWS